MKYAPSKPADVGAPAGQQASPFGVAVLDTNASATDPDYQQAIDVELPSTTPATRLQPLSRHALYRDHDVKFWLDVLVREGKVKPGELDPEGIATNKYNAYAGAGIFQH